MRERNRLDSRYGRWTVLTELPGSRVEVVCDCGKRKVVRKQYLQDGSSRSCGCLRAEPQQATPPGLRFGRLQVMENLGAVDRQHRAVCRCDCGKFIVARLADLRSGTVGSCGCFRKESTGNRFRKHGQAAARTPLYQCWVSLRERTRRPKRWPSYAGVTVFPAWNDYVVFAKYVEDNLGPRPGKGFSLDRIDNSRGYEPGNLRWATPRQQARNRKSNVMLTIGAESKCMAEWADSSGVPEATILQRVKRLGWSHEQAVVTPAGPTHTPITYKGETHSISGWARILGIKTLTLAKRLRPKSRGGGGWTVEEALGSGTGDMRHRTEARKDADRQRSTAVMLTIDGTEQCIAAWAEASGTPHATITGRIRRGWPHKEAVFGKKVSE